MGADKAVCCADAVHPEQQTKPAFGRVRKGSNPAVKTTAGRGRVNIHGALNLETFDAPFVEPTTIDGVSAAQLLSGTGARNPDKRIIHVCWHVIWHVIIHVIRDNAACPKGPDVRAFLARPDCRIHLVQLPPYCPHINPIERLSALIHQHVTHNRHGPTQKQFANAILRFLRETIPNEWKTFPSQAEAKYQTTFASQQSQHMRNSGFSGDRGIVYNLGAQIGNRAPREMQDAFHASINALDKVA